MEDLNELPISSEILELPISSENEKLKAEIEDLQYKNKGLCLMIEGMPSMLAKSQKLLDQQERTWIKKFNEYKEFYIKELKDITEMSKNMTIMCMNAAKEPLLETITKLEAEAEIALAKTTKLEAELALIIIIPKIL